MSAAQAMLVGVGFIAAVFALAMGGGLLAERYKAWRERRHWQRQHLDFVRGMVNDDWRWLAANPIADALTTRYRAALSPDWFKRQHEPVDQFRRRIGLEPTYGVDAAPKAVDGGM